MLDNESEEYKDAAYVFIANLPYGRIMTGEQIGIEFYREHGEPHHPNAWGGIINAAVFRKLLKRYGQGRMKRAKSHGRETPRYITGTWKKRPSRRTK